MPQVNICLWNVQNYGTAVAARGTSARRWGVAERVRNCFIKAFVDKYALDVLMLMEVTPVNGMASLRDLIWRLGHGGASSWAFSYCGSALVGDDPNPQTRNDLQFKTGRRNEGYGVVWRIAADRFQLLRGVNPIATATEMNGGAAVASPLNLVTMGRPLKETQVVGGKTYAPLGGFTQASPKPCDEHQNPVSDWTPLKFPVTAAQDWKALRMGGARRPAYVVLKLTGVDGDRAALCPVGVYHAPSRPERSSWAPFRASMSRELYVTNGSAGLVPSGALGVCEKAVLGGDFNYAAPVWPGEYGHFVAPFTPGPDGGADCGAVPNGGEPESRRNTTVQLLEPDQKTPITSNDPDAYLSLAIDEVFFRPGRGTFAAERVNLLTAMMNEPAQYKRGLEALRNALGALEAQMHGTDRRVGMSGPEMRASARSKWTPCISAGFGATFLDYPKFKRQVTDVCTGAANQMQARQAAECVHLFISDHLPFGVTLRT